MRPFLLMSLLITLLSACAGAPKFNTAGVDRSVTPRSAVAEADVNRGKTVLWGGVILTTTNLAANTQIEVLAYPLDGDSRPQRDSDPLGRFIISHSGFLEPASYGEGRLVTVLGSVSSTLEGKVGASDYRYPVIDARQLHLWSKDSGLDRSNVHFGIGVGIGL